MDIDDRLQHAIDLASKRTALEHRVLEWRRKAKMWTELKHWGKAKKARKEAERLQTQAEEIRRTLQTMLDRLAKELAGRMEQ